MIDQSLYKEIKMIGWSWLLFMSLPINGGMDWWAMIRYMIPGWMKVLLSIQPSYTKVVAMGSRRSIKNIKI